MIENYVGEIDYKELHNLLLKRKKWLEDISTENETAAAEIAEIEVMMISVRNMYKRINNIPIRWKFGQKHPYTKKRTIIA